MYLESPNNSRVKEWSQLKNKKGRTEQGRFLVEGYRLVEEALRSGLAVDALLWDVGTDELPETLQEAAYERGVPIFELSPKAFASVSDTVTPQGVIAVVQKPRFGKNGGQTPTSRVLLLDGLQDPGNVGTLLRCADAFGIEEVCCGTGTVDPYSPKVVRASMGGIFRLSVVVEDAVKYIRNWLGCQPNGRVVMSSADASIECDAFDFTRPFILVIGSEAFGVSDAVRTLATDDVKIPMVGMTESLNAAMAGSVLLYEAFRQRRGKTPC
jgi:RNA methyltransferase, TrmH family